MIRINLLPHREIKRKARKQQFFVHAGMCLALAAVVAFALHLTYQGHVDNQTARNQYIKDRNAELDKQIAEIKTLQQQINSLLSRKQVIESLQEHRSETVRLFNEMIARLPDGVFIKTVKQTGQALTFTGFSQSNARVSTLMRNIESSDLLGSPQLVEVKSSTLNNRRVSEFTLKVDIKRTQAASENDGFGGGSAGKGAAGNAGKGAAGKQPNKPNTGKKG